MYKTPRCLFLVIGLATIVNTQVVVPLVDHKILKEKEKCSTSQYYDSTMFKCFACDPDADNSNHLVPNYNGFGCTCAPGYFLDNYRENDPDSEENSN